MSNTENNATEVNAPVVAKKAPLFKKLAQFQTEDGQIFETQKAATEHMRKHLVVAAVGAVAALYTGVAVDADGDEQEQSLAEFLLANKDAVIAAYDAAKVDRPPVTEETKAKMKAAREKRQLAVAPVEPAASAE